MKHELCVRVFLGCVTVHQDLEKLLLPLDYLLLSACHTETNTTVCVEFQREAGGGSEWMSS